MLLVLPARAQEVATPEPQAYRAVMAAQYAARQQPIPARPEEAQKIYDDYLRSIGRPIKERPEEPQENMTTPSH
ncbi:MAG TPA: hypothetical protein VHC39_11480 [Rhizomicrobium sp.]|nr:hypothetical protein [Rhizomicrobium sp.]